MVIFWGEKSNKKKNKFQQISDWNEEKKENTYNDHFPVDDVAIVLGLHFLFINKPVFIGDPVTSFHGVNDLYKKKEE